MPNNRKITDLPSIVPRSDLKFVVATDANNFSVSLGDISTSITDQLPAGLIGQDDLIASGNFLHNYIFKNCKDSSGKEINKYEHVKVLIEDKIKLFTKY